jgi:hypothetical protein
MSNDNERLDFTNQVIAKLSNDPRLGTMIETLCSKTLGPWQWDEKMQMFVRRDMFNNVPQSVVTYATTPEEQWFVDASLEEKGWVLIDPPGVRRR